MEATRTVTPNVKIPLHPQIAKEWLQLLGITDITPDTRLHIPKYVILEKAVNNEYSIIITDVML